MQTQSSFTRLLVLFMALLFAAAVFIYYSTSKMAGSELVQEFEQREARTLEVVKWVLAGKAPYAGVEQFAGQIREIAQRFDLRITEVREASEEEIEQERRMALEGDGGLDLGSLLDEVESGAPLDRSRLH